MRIKTISFLMAGLLAGLAPAAQSAAQGRSPEQQARLEQSARRVDSELSGKTGGMQRAELRRQQEQIEDAMRRLKAGQKVTTEEIDQILGEVSFERAQ